MKATSLKMGRVAATSRMKNLLLLAQAYSTRTLPLLPTAFRAKPVVMPISIRTSLTWSKKNVCSTCMVRASQLLNQGVLSTDGFILQISIIL